MDKQRSKALNWLDLIKGDVQALVVHNHIFWEVQKAIRENQFLVDTPSVFYECLAQTFANSTVMGVRRQADRHDDVVSMLKLLTLLKQHPRILSRSYYVSLRSDTLQAERNFSELAGENAEALAPAFFEADIEELTAKTDRLRHLANRRIAHLDARGLKHDQPRFDELTEAISFLEATTIKYLALMKAEMLGTLLPTFQYDWKKVFTVPWIVRGRSSPS